MGVKILTNLFWSHPYVVCCPWELLKRQILVFRTIGEHLSCLAGKRLTLFAAVITLWQESLGEMSLTLGYAWWAQGGCPRLEMTFVCFLITWHTIFTSQASMAVMKLLLLDGRKVVQEIFYLLVSRWLSLTGQKWVFLGSHLHLFSNLCIRDTHWLCEVNI